MEIYTIGFTKKTASQFFGLLKAHGIKRVIDIRLNNSSQLAGFSKRDDLKFFLEAICGAEYLHEPLLAPTSELINRYRENKDWNQYERDFCELMASRQIEHVISKALFEVPTALLCTEATPDCCHRRLVAEYLQEKWPNVTVKHI